MSKLFLCSIFSFGLIFLSQRTLVQKPQIKPKVYPFKYQKQFTFGFKDFMADILWLRVIQNSDFCENKDASKAVNSGANLDEIIGNELRDSRCHLGWVFQMLDLISDLAPKFRKIYRFGGDMLAIAVDDREGAKRIYDKGLRVFPDYWQLAYSASYLYLFELQDPKTAARLLIQAANSGGPDWFRQMAGTLYTKAGEYILGEIVLKSFLEDRKSGRGVERAKKLLEEIRQKKKALKQ